MSGAHLHLMLNHLPVVGTLGVLLLLAIAVVRRSDELARVALGLLVFVAMAAAAVMATGETAEELVEHVAGVTDASIHAHEELAELTALWLYVLGATALGTLAAFRRRALPRWIVVTGLVVTLLPSGLATYTALLGGRIRHTELTASSPTEAPREREESR